MPLSDEYLFKAREYVRKARRRSVTRIKTLVYSAVHRCKTSGRMFDPAIIDVLTKPAPKICRCCKKRLDYTTGRGRGKFWNSASIDRVNNEFGYVIGNVAIICMECNYRKRNLSLDQIKQFATYVEIHAKII